MRRKRPPTVTLERALVSWLESETEYTKRFGGGRLACNERDLLLWLFGYCSVADDVRKRVLEKFSRRASFTGRFVAPSEEYDGDHPADWGEVPSPGFADDDE